MPKKIYKYCGRFLIIVLVVTLMIVCINYNQSPTNIVERRDKEWTLVINEVLIDNLAGLMDEDRDYTDWIEIYNYGDKDINLQGFGLSDDLDDPFCWTFPNVVVASKSFLLVRASGKDRKENMQFLHTNFKLNKDGENIVLTSQDGVTVDLMTVPKTKSNISYGRKPDGSDQYVIFQETTPNESNNYVNVFSKVTPMQRLETPTFSYNGGFYKDELELEISTTNDNMIIFYTLDGSEPNLNSLIYKKPILIKSKEGERSTLSQYVSSGSPLWKFNAEQIFMGTVVRARAYLNGVLSDEIVTNTYFIDPHYTLPIISIATDTDNLFDYEDGIYTEGAVKEGWTLTNFKKGKSWEREAHLEMFEPDGEQVISQDVGIRVSGSRSRANFCKSLGIYARKEYDEKNTIHYNIFPGLENKIGEEIYDFKRLKLRTSGQDFNKTMFKDVLAQSLIAELGMDTQAYRPSILFINGEYWGIHNIRENLDEYYIEEHYRIDKKDVVMLERAKNKEKMAIAVGKEKDIEPYEQLINFVQENDMAVKENYEYVKSQIDIDNFLRYNVAQIYIGNLDWPDNNVKIWRKRVKANTEEVSYEDGRWRWMIYDTDWGFTYYDHNTIKYVLDSTAKDTMDNYESHPRNHNDWNNILLQQLLKNEEFKAQFIELFNNCLETVFKPEYVTQRIEQMALAIKPEISEHLQRWTLEEVYIGKMIHKVLGDTSWNEKIDWEEEVEELIEFANKRPIYIREYLEQYLQK